MSSNRMKIIVDATSDLMSLVKITCLNTNCLNNGDKTEGNTICLLKRISLDENGYCMEQEYRSNN
jgi:hypothetical protein